jgi:hypothetical protein
MKQQQLAISRDPKLSMRIAKGPNLHKSILTQKCVTMKSNECKEKKGSQNYFSVGQDVDEIVLQKMLKGVIV